MSVKPALLVGGAILAMAVAAGAWLAWPRHAASLVVAQAPLPPEPTSADFASATGARTSETPPAPEAASSPPAPSPPASSTPADWTALPIDELRTRANANELPAMEEMGRRLVNGIGIPKDQQAGAGWLLRAAQRGSAQSAFNVGVMYERGFVVERDSVRALEWYRKAVEANLPLAKHHLALLLREGKGAPRNGPEAVALLRSASRQGMTASMFALGDIYERGDAAPKDLATALAWYAITAEFERQTNRDGENTLAKTAEQRAEALKRTLLPGDLERAQQISHSEFKQIVETLQPPMPATDRLPPPALPPLLPRTAAAVPPPPPAPEPDSPGRPEGWPMEANDQIRVIQQGLVDLKFLRDKPDGAIGPMTRTAIRAFQQSVGARETGEPTMDVFVALQEALARRDAAASVPVPTIDLGKPEPPPAPPTSSDIVRADPDAWPASTVDQLWTIQRLLRELNFARDEPDGEYGPATRAAILDYERTAGLAQTGDPGKALFESLKATRDKARKPD